MSYPQMSTDVPWSLVKSGFKKTPIFNTLRQMTTSGYSSAIGLMPYPRWGFEVDLDYVVGGEAVKYSILQKFLSCYLECNGGAQFFLFTDPVDNSVESADDGDGPVGVLLNVTPGAASPMAQVGDGVSTQFQFARKIGNGIDLLQNVSDAEITVDGTITAPASISAKGVVTFSTAPDVGAVLGWEGNFQYLCQFTEDTLKGLARVSRNSAGILWACPSVAFESVFV